MDPYALFGLAPGASVKEIKKRYRELLARHHVDKAGGDDPTQLELTKRITVAYRELLSRIDDEPAMPGAELHATLTVPLAVTITGGKVETTTLAGETVEVRIPAGVDDGDKLRLRGMGGFGEPRGDLVVEIKIETDKGLAWSRPLKEDGRRGLDVELELTVSWLEAYRGDEVKIDTPWGPKWVPIRPSPARDGDRLRLPGFGVRARAQVGDFVVVLRLHPPPFDERLLAVLIEVYGRSATRPAPAIA